MRGYRCFAANPEYYIMKRLFSFFLTCYCIQALQAQTTANDSARTFLKKLYRVNQKQLDISTTGIGIEHSSVHYGDHYLPVHFNKIVIRANIAEFKVGVGNADYYSPITNLYYNTEVKNWSLGINYPLSALGIGRANSTKGIRLVPFFAADFGHSTFKDYPSNSKLATSFHLTVAPGYRLKLPYFIVEARLNTTWNNLTETRYHPNVIAITTAGDLVKEKSFKTFSFTPSISIIIDGLFSRFNPQQSRISGSMAVYDKITTENFYRNESYNANTGRTEKEGLYKTETTYEYHAESVTLPINDVGAFIGIGPRLLFKPAATNSYHMPSLMGGIGAHARVALLSFDLNADKGTAGFASQAKTDGRILKTETKAKGNFDMTNLTANVGIDLGPVLLSFLGILAKRNGETPYFNISGGYSIGYSFIGNYRYNNPVVGKDYQDYFDANPGERTKYTDAASNKSGMINGWYIGAEVGAVGFRYEFNKYKNAPLARCAYYAISYKYPLLRSRHKTGR
jgi:hypothetical protein